MNQIFYTGITAPSRSADVLAGIELIHLPTIRVRYDPPATFDRLVFFLKQNPYLVFLSKNGVTAFRRWLREGNQTLGDSTITAWGVGRRTAELVRQELGLAARTPPVESAAGLMEAFQTLDQRPLILVCGHSSLPEFPTWLVQKGWTYLRIPVYRTDPVSNPQLKRRFTNREEETVFFTSPSTVEGFLGSVQAPDLKGIVARLASLGPTTSRAIRAREGTVFFESSEANLTSALAGLVGLIYEGMPSE